MVLRERIDSIRKLIQAGVPSVDSSGFSAPVVHKVSVPIQGQDETICLQIIYRGELAIVCATSGRYLRWVRKYNEFQFCSTDCRWADEAIDKLINGVFEQMDPTTNSSDS